MTKHHVNKRLRYSGYIRVAGMDFKFETSATSDKEALNNGIAQYSKQLNMSIARLRRYMKEHGAKTDTVPMEENSGKA